MKINIKVLVFSFIIFHVLWSIYDVISLTEIEQGFAYLLGFFTARIIADFWLRSVWIIIATLIVTFAYGFLKHKEDKKI